MICCLCRTSHEIKMAGLSLPPSKFIECLTSREGMHYDDCAWLTMWTNIDLNRYIIDTKIDGLKQMHLQLQIWRHFRYLSIPSLKVT